MSPDEIQHFLVSVDPRTEKTDVRKFGTDYEAAQRAYAQAERDNEDAGGELDVVLLSADSLATIKQTHSSYFDSERKRLKELLAS